MRETDLAIIGAGVAGLTAAAAAARAGLAVLVIERMGAGGQVMTVDRIDNFPGHPEGIAGYELGPMLQEQAENAGAEFALDEVMAVQAGPEGGYVLRCEGEDVAARAVLVACGSRRRPLQVPGEAELEGRGVSHCASCDGPLYRGKQVCVAGGGDSALGEAIVLAAHAARVRVVFPAPEPHAQPYLREGARARGNIELVPQARVVGITSDAAGLTGVELQASGGAARHLPAHGLFVYAGLAPDAGFLDAAVPRDGQGRIEVDAQLRTSWPGLFAAGDVRTGSPWLLSSAAQDGNLAAASAAHYLQGD